MFEKFGYVVLREDRNYIFSIYTGYGAFARAHARKRELNERFGYKRKYFVKKVSINLFPY